MAKINVSLDTSTNEFKIELDGKTLDNVKDVEVYQRMIYDEPQYTEPVWACKIYIRDDSMDDYTVRTDISTAVLADKNLILEVGPSKAHIDIVNCMKLAKG